MDPRLSNGNNLPPYIFWRGQARRCTQWNRKKKKDLPPSAIDIPQPVYGNNYPRTRSLSPLRSGFKVDPQTGDIQSEDGSNSDNDNADDHDATWGRRTHSPTRPSPSSHRSFLSVSDPSLAACSTTPSGLPTDEELEREAERDRERSRIEAERILTGKAEERYRCKETLSQSMPSFETPVPTPSQREKWHHFLMKPWRKKEAKKAEKNKMCSGEWPNTPESKYSNTALLSLRISIRPTALPSRLLRRSPVSFPRAALGHQVAFLRRKQPKSLRYASQPARLRSWRISPTLHERYTVTVGKATRKPRMSAYPPPNSMTASASANVTDNDEETGTEVDALDSTIGCAAVRVAAI
ncbi:hypothetical protein EI94DRAFT_1804049 [Lactarius quietus]|nr:hypothetical protein EI94DRAFT_1804049 [Lactarius quietus]